MSSQAFKPESTINKPADNTNQHSTVSAADIFSQAQQGNQLDTIFKSKESSTALPGLSLVDSSAQAPMAAAQEKNYGKILSNDDHNLNADLKALEHDKKGGAAYNSDLRHLGQNEQQLRQDVFAFRQSAPDFQTFSSTMEAEHAALKNTAKGLWDIGLKKEAGETTAYYPLNHYEKYFANRGPQSGSGHGTGTGDGGDPNQGNPDPGEPIGPPKGATQYGNLDTASIQKPNSIASEIGGSGDVQSINAEQLGPNETRFTLTGGKWGDGLWATGIKNEQAANANEIQLNAKFTLTPEDLKNDHEIEKDIVIQKKDGAYGTAGTQINPKTGEVDYWNTQKSQWVDVGSLGPLQANKEYDLQIGVTSHDSGNAKTGTYNYDYYALNGTKLDASQTMFGTKPMNWTPGVYVQTQLDLPNVPNGSVAGMTESGESLYLA